MECLIVLGLLAAAVGAPLLLGWWGRKSRLAKVVLTLLLPAAALYSVGEFRKVVELEGFLEQEAVYPLDFSRAGAHRLTIAPLKGPIDQGVRIRAVQKGSDPAGLRELLHRLNWKETAASNSMLFPKGDEAEEGVVILD